jgi:hypothetical protein
MGREGAGRGAFFGPVLRKSVGAIAATVESLRVEDLGRHVNDESCPLATV